MNRKLTPYEIGVIDREAGGRETLAEAGLALHSLFTLSEIL